MVELVYVEELRMINRNSPEVKERIELVRAKKREAEVVTLREWYDTTPNHCGEIANYMATFNQLGRLGKELHKRNVPRVTERFGDEVRTLVEATYLRRDLDYAAPLCALSCVFYRKAR